MTGMTAASPPRARRKRLADVELDPLRQRQLGRVVDGRRLPPHVRLPGVGARLAAAAGPRPPPAPLPPPERPADLGAGRADVDVRDPAVGADRRQELLRLAQV